MSEPNWYQGDYLHTCTTPDPGGAGNITNEPAFVDAIVSNFHLQTTSPCIDAGSNQLWMVGTTDLDAALRIQNGVVDMGCYEMDIGRPDSDGDDIDDQWELFHFLSLTNISFASDWDQDGFQDGYEFHAGTRPTDADSYLGITSVSIDPLGNEVILRWTSVSNRLYSLHGSSNLVTGSKALMEEHIPATPPENVFPITLDNDMGSWYGVEVETQP